MQLIDFTSGDDLVMVKEANGDMYPFLRYAAFCGFKQSNLGVDYEMLGSYMTVKEAIEAIEDEARNEHHFFTRQVRDKLSHDLDIVAFWHDDQNKWVINGDKT